MVCISKETLLIFLDKDTDLLTCIGSPKKRNKALPWCCLSPGWGQGAGIGKSKEHTERSGGKGK